MKKTLQELRSEIADIDASILSSLYERKLRSLEIAERKHARRSPLHVPRVEESVYRRNRQTAKKLGLEESFVIQITKRILAQSLRWQREYLERD